jgi:hypothetical protein
VAKTPAFTEIGIELDREKAMDKASARQNAAEILRVLHSK